MFKDDTINILADPVKELVCPECEHAIDVSGRDMLSAVVCPKCESKLTVPARLGDFILVEALGAGGMATVYKAYDESLGRYVAVKIMRRKFGQDPKFVERFLREARAAARINHPNVVQIYSCAAKNGQPYIVMEFVDGGKFDELIAQKSPLNERRVIEIGIDVANGLRAASDIGLVHGDIKPANIIFDRNGLAKVADFGLAHFVQEQEERNEIWGTPYYIAPERARKKNQDHRADIYCLGATLFHALAGEPPFDGETAVDVVMERLKHPAPDLRELRPELSATTVKVIARMLEADKLRRYPNYNSLMSDLEKALEGGGSETVIGKAATSDRKRARAPATPAKSGGGKKFLLVALTFLLLAGASVGAWLLLRSSAPDTTDEPVAAPTPQGPQLQPFEAERDARLSAILAELSPSTSIAGERDLLGLSQGMARNDPRRMWLRILSGVAAILQGENDTALRHYRAVAEAEDLNEAAELPRRVAAYMVGESDSLVPPEGEEWPQWYGNLELLFAGVNKLATQATEPALESLKEFADKSRTAEDPAWPYSLQPLARDLAVRIEAWRTMIGDELEPMVAEGKLDEALGMLRARVKTGLFRPLRDAKIAEIDVLRKQQQEEQKRRDAEERQRRQAEAAARKAEEDRAAETERMQSWREQSQALLMENRYAEALELADSVTEQVDTADLKKEIVARRSDLDFLVKMKKFIVAALNSAPYDGSANMLNGTAVAATEDEIIVRASGRTGQSAFGWDRVTPQLLIPMAQFYLSQARIEDSQRADVFMGLAVYSEIHNLGIESRFIRYAEQFKPGIAGERAANL